MVDGIAIPEVTGLDRLADLDAARRAAAGDLRPQPPQPRRHRADDPVDPDVLAARPRVAAAADYFFDKQWKAALSALALNAIPIDREVTGRTFERHVPRPVADGHSLLIYPEGGRSPDGWGQEFKGGAAYLSARTGAPVVPVFIDGTGAIFGKGMKRPKPGRTEGGLRCTAHGPAEDENTRRFNARIEAAVTRLGDEALTDYWTATKRAAQGRARMLTGPEYNGWRRQWELAEHRKLGAAGLRRRQKRRWPDLG